MIIVSLTSIPPRFDYLYITINSILSQTIVPDKIVINIPKKYNNFSNDYELPCFFNEKVIIHNNCKDYGPATKLLGLHNFEVYNDMSEDDIIIIVDDDRIYNDNLIKNMILFHEKHIDKVLTVAGWDMENVTNDKYKNENKKEPRGIEYKKEGYCDFLGGCCGYLISKTNCPFNYSEIFNLHKDDDKYYVDDIWLSGFLTLNNTDIYLIPNATGRDEPRHQNDFISPLFDKTRSEKNIKCIEFLREKYNIWKRTTPIITIAFTVADIKRKLRLRNSGSIMYKV